MRRLLERLVCPDCCCLRVGPGHLVRVMAGICRL